MKVLRCLSVLVTVTCTSAFCAMNSLSKNRPKKCRTKAINWELFTLSSHRQWPQPSSRCPDPAPFEGWLVSNATPIEYRSAGCGVGYGRCSFLGYAALLRRLEFLRHGNAGIVRFERAHSNATMFTDTEAQTTINSRILALKGY